MPESHPLISILMPYYNIDDFLLEAVQSVRAQTYANWELIVVDDGSAQGLPNAILDTFADSRIHLVRHDTNRGIGVSRNTAASNSKGQFLLPLDSDDLLAPNYIERTLKAIQDEGASAAHTDVKVFGLLERTHAPSTNLTDIFAGRFPHNTLLIKREAFDAVGGYDTESLIEDTEFWISVIEAGTKFAYVPEPLYLYRKHPRSFSQSRQIEKLRDLFAAMSKHHISVAEHLPGILERWIQMEEGRIEQKLANKELVVELAHLEKEFAALKERFDNLESKVSRNEKILASIPKLTRQFLFLAFKPRTGTQSHV